MAEKALAIVGGDADWLDALNAPSSVAMDETLLLLQRLMEREREEYVTMMALYQLWKETAVSTRSR